MRTLSILIKPASGACNMRCRYCFYTDVMEIREIKSYGLMTLHTLEALIKNAFAESTEFCAFGFQGGEPTLAGLDFFRAFIALEKQHNVNHIKTSCALQTNGLLLDDEWAAFLAENKFLVGLSIDGEKKTHDGLRLDAADKGTHSRTMKAARLLAKAGAEFNILSVISRQLAAHPDNAYSFYKREGFRYIQFIPCLDGLEEAPGINSYSLGAKDYGKFLCRIFDLWYADYIKGEYVSVRTFDNYIRMLAGHPPENCAMDGSCTAYPLVEADGSVYPCDFYAIDSYRLGNVSTHSFGEMLSGETAHEFETASRQTHPDCVLCEYGFICRGGCRRDREPIVESVPGLDRYCEAYRSFFSHTLPRMRMIARQLATERKI